MDLIVVFIVGWAFRTAWLHATGRLRDSRQARVGEREKQLAPKQMTPLQRRATAARHDTGWWLREAFQGFPVTRYGWHAGWVAHQAAAEQQRAIRDEHRGVRDSFRAIRAQGRENVQVLEKSPEPLPRDQMKKKLQAASPPAQSPAEQGREAAKTAHPASLPAPVPAAAGTPLPAVAVPPVQKPEPAEGVTVPAQTATPETTYSQDIARCDKIIAACDVEAVRLRLEQAAAWVEEMVAAGLDAKNTGIAADLSDRIEDQIKANRATHDYAVALKVSIQRDHQAGHEYHTSARDGGASREYLRD